MKSHMDAVSLCIAASEVNDVSLYNIASLKSIIF